MGQGVPSVAGGIGQLRRLLTEYDGAIRRDLLLSGLRLDDLGTARLTWADLWAFVQYPPKDSALVRATDPDHWISPEIQILREVKHELDVLVWMQTKDAQRRSPQNYPERMPLTAAARAAAEAAAAPEYDVEPIEDIAAFLGWHREPKT